MGRWITRFAGNGAMWGAAAAASPALSMVVTDGAKLTNLEVLTVLTSLGAIGAASGALVTGGLGVVHALDLTRGKTPWRSLVLAFALGPCALGLVVLFLKFVANLLGMQ